MVGTGPLARMALLVALRPLVAVRPLVAGATMVAGATIIVNTFCMSLQAVYGYSLDTKRYSVRVVCNYQNLSCLHLRSDCSSLVIVCCILCVKHIVGTSELETQRRKWRDTINRAQR